MCIEKLFKAVTIMDGEIVPDYFSTKEEAMIRANELVAAGKHEGFNIVRSVSYNDKPYLAEMTDGIEFVIVYVEEVTL